MLFVIPAEIPFLETMVRVIIVHHHEITLKGDNRGFFERQLQRNIRRSLEDLMPGVHIGGGYGRFILEIGGDVPHDEIMDRLSRVFGIANFCSGYRLNQDIDAFCALAAELLDKDSFKTLKVDARRTDKRFAFRSMEVNRIVGEFLCQRYGVRADMTNPDRTVHIEIVDGKAYLYLARRQGAGGLPSGVSGNVVALLSAGFDSPVASWMMMKRGATVDAVHFHSMPYTGEQSVEQVRRLVRRLVAYQFRMRLTIVPFAPAQQEIVLLAPQPLRVILYRRMMIRIAEAVARSASAEGIVTGESVGQVASQTLRNIRAIDEVATLPIFRPLAGSDKEEIMAIARDIGTYDISKDPFDDCCSFLAPRKPETWADLGAVLRAEEKLETARMVSEALAASSSEVYRFPEISKQVHADQLQP